MSDRHQETEVTSLGYFGSVKKALTGALLGLILFIGAFPLLVWNEGRSYAEQTGLAEFLQQARSVAPTEIKPINEGLAIHVIGDATAGEPITDDRFGIRVTGALRLLRKVEMYQWQEDRKTEERDRLGGGTETVTTYSYRKVWSEQAIDSGGFHVTEGHQNPPMPFETARFNGTDVRLGGFRLGDPVLNRLHGFQPVALAERPVPAGFELRDGVFYKPGEGAGWGRSDGLEIGDIRLTYHEVPVGPVSIMGRQSGERITEFVSGNERRYLLVESGRHFPDAMIAEAKAQNAFLTWILRVVGIVLIWIGLSLIFGLLGQIAGFIPFVRALVDAVGGGVALLVAVALGGLTIALSWVFVRPWIGLPLLAGVVLVAIIAVFMGRKRATEKADVAASP